MLNKNLKKEIWEKLSKGKFICTDSVDLHQRELYKTIHDNEEELRAFFGEIGYNLIHGREYYIFSREVSSENLEASRSTVKKYIVICDMLKSFNSEFCQGLSFTKANLLEAAATYPDLKAKIQEFSRRDNYKDIVTNIIGILKTDGIIEKDNNSDIESYIVTSAYNYLEDLFNATIIYNEQEEPKHEISE
jgi:hypothetical protein